MAHSIVIFDIDNTLTESRSPISRGLAKLLSKLLTEVKVGLISGESMEDFEKQIISHLKHANLENLYALPTCGAELRVYKDGEWKQVYSYPIDNHKRRLIIEKLSKGLSIMPVALGEYLYDRGSQITYSALGKHASLEDKYAWDPDRTKRRQIVETLRSHLPGITMTIGGSTSIDFTEEGIDKRFGVGKLLEYLHIQPHNALFVGDALYEGGNDAPVKKLGIDTRDTSSLDATYDIIKKLLFEESAERRKLTVAYFCSEYGVEEDIPMYAGGLGILAGDMVKEAGERHDLNFLAFGLISRRGQKTLGVTKENDYSEKLIQAGFKKLADQGKEFIIEIPAPGRKIKVATWRKMYGTAALYLFDSKVEGNNEHDQLITDYLYDTDRENKIIQEVILGIAPVRLMAKLSIVPDFYHFNEGHAAIGALSVILEHAKSIKSKDFNLVAKNIKHSLVGSKHTILSGAGLYFSRAEFDKFLAPYIQECGCDVEDAYAYGALERDFWTFSTTRFMIQACSVSNGVSVAHVKAEKVTYPHSALIPITNGVAIDRWQSDLWHKNKKWRTNDAELASIKAKLRKELIHEVNKKTGSNLSENTLTLVWARRFASYKRPGLLFNDVNRLKAIVNNASQPVQIIVAGRVHPLDAEGIEALTKVKKTIDDKTFNGKITYLSDYSIPVAKMLVQGADVWLNTPIPGFEACGTSGMKAGLNGAYMMSTDDGWVSEVPELKKEGCIIPEGNIAEGIYDLIENKVAKSFYQDGKPGTNGDWVGSLRKTIEITESGFSAARMLDDYIDKLYNKNS
jgi:alpha-glucan phosphorylase-like protein/HAD superfamily hydrolase (TIGR01484 family)